MKLPRNVALVSLLILSVAAVSVWLSPRVYATAANRAQVEEPPDVPQVRPSQTKTPLRLRSGLFDPLQSPPIVSPSLARTPSPDQRALRLVQFTGPVKDAWHEAMVDQGLEIVTYIPDFAYLVWGTRDAVARVANRAPVRWHGPYQGDYALHPALGRLRLAPEAGNSQVRVAVQLYHHDAAKRSLAAIDKRAVRILRPAYTVRGLTTVGVEVAFVDLAWLATLPDVVSVEPLITPQLSDEVQGQIIAGHLTPDGAAPAGTGYLQWLTATLGLTTTPSAYPIVDVADDGIDDGDGVPQHPDFYQFGDPMLPDRLAYNANWTTDPTADGGGGHGTINAAIVGGYNDRAGFPYEDGDGYNYGLGVNPLGRVAGSKIFGNTSGWAFPDYTELVGVSYALGARIVSNSWGDDTSAGEYLIDDQTYDALVRDADATIPGNQEMTILFAAGNSGYGGSGTVGSPGNAKNVITVGASESYRPTWIDGCFIGQTGADNAADIAGFSSQGPTADGRVKPEIVAPGTHIQGAASQTPNYTGDYVCDAYHPSGQTLYAASSGTSHATPAVAGAASLLFRYYQDRFGSGAPSPAMVKAYLINAARYLDGDLAADTLPSNRQGYGRVDLGLGFDDVPRVVSDQQIVLRETGETYVLEGHVAQPDHPFRVTLAWTDAPGSTVGDAYVNDLNLEVTIGDLTYRGNVFSGAFSIAGGAFDPRNNVESVSLPPGVQGGFVITITANNLPGDGLPGNVDVTDQDFALVCYNCSLQPSFDIDVVPVVREICRPSDAVYTVTTTSIGGFNGSILLDVSGHPTETTATLAPNPVDVGASSWLTISDTGPASAGRYTLSVRGQSGQRQMTQTVGLDLVDAPPDRPSPLAPTDGVTEVTTRPELVWSGVSQAAYYSIEVATDAAFENVAYEATLEATPDVVRHTLTRALDYETRYFWRIKAFNACGASLASEAASFTTEGRPTALCRSPLAAIPDNDALGMTDTLWLPNLGTLIDLDVAITATHTWVGDLIVSLEHVESGQSALLYDRPGVPATTLGCSGDNLDIVLDDDASLVVEDLCANTDPAYPPGIHLQPNELLSAFDGDLSEGRWELRVADLAAQDLGTLDSWCLIPQLVTETMSPDIAFAQEVYTAGLAPALVPITVTLNHGAFHTVTVDYATDGGSAVEGVNYLTSTGVLTFGRRILTQRFFVPVLDLSWSEAYTVALKLSDPMSATLALPDRAVLRLPQRAVRELYVPIVMR